MRTFAFNLLRIVIVLGLLALGLANIEFKSALRNGTLPDWVMVAAFVLTPFIVIWIIWDAVRFKKAPIRKLSQPISKTVENDERLNN
ncbi:MAG: hypothetical protein QM667_02745 [Asticcacaulis sp.]